MRRAIKTCKHKILLRMLHQYDWLSVVNIHVDELSCVRIWQHTLCATLSANWNIKYRLPIKVYYRICTAKQIWKPECVLSFIMGWQIYVNLSANSAEAIIYQDKHISHIPLLLFIPLKSNNHSMIFHHFILTWQSSSISILHDVFLELWFCCWMLSSILYTLNQDL